MRSEDQSNRPPSTSISQESPDLEGLKTKGL